MALANATQFGLVAGIWTRDGGRQFRMAKRVQSGQVFINNYGAGGGVELPFGGVGDSGYGRVHGDEGLRALCVQQIIVEPGPLRRRREPWWQPYDGHALALRFVDRALDVVDRLRR